MSFHIPIWDRTEREMISVPRFKSNSASEICGNYNVKMRKCQFSEVLI